MVDLIDFNAGGGQRASALALEAAINRQMPTWQVRLINLFGVLDPQGKFRGVTGSAPEDGYNKRLARGLTLAVPRNLSLSGSARRKCCVAANLA